MLEFKLKIERDDDAESPRELDNLGVMVCFHKQHSLGDENDLTADDFDGWDAMKRYLKALKARHILPLYLMDHGGLAMSVEPFGCMWDSGQVGFIYTTDELIKKMGMIDWPETQVEACLKAEVEVYSKYLAGECYCYVITDSNGEVVDSCCGFYGHADVQFVGNSALAGFQADRDDLYKRLNAHFKLGDLDDHVHEVKAQEASAINNAGQDEQIDFLLRACGADWLEQLLKEDC